MKKIKAFLSMLCIVAMMPLMVVHADTGYGYDPADAQKTAEELILELVSMTDEELEYYSNNAMGWTSSAAEVLLTYRENGTLGAYIDDEDITLKEEGEKLILTKCLHFEEGNLEATATMAKIGQTIRVTDIQFKVIENDDKSMGEKMANAAFNTVIGIVSVFLVLLLISFIISMFKYISRIQEAFSKKKKKTETEIETDKTESAFDKVTTEIEEKQEHEDGIELIAVITAAICASTGTPSDSFVVRSIKRVDTRRKR